MAWMLLLPLALAAPRALEVHLDRRSSFKVPRANSAVGVESLNHQLDGGLYSQLLFGESFEEVALSANDSAREWGGLFQGPDEGGGSADGDALPGRRRRLAGAAGCDCCYRHGCSCCYEPPPSDVGFIGCASRLPAGAPPPQVSKMWLPLAAPGAAARFQLGSRDARHGAQYQSVALDPGSHGPVGVANYGLFCLHGLHLLAGRGRTRGWPC